MPATRTTRSDSLRQSARLLGEVSSRGFLSGPEFPRLWHGFRLYAGLMTMLICVFLGAFWGWLGGLFAGALAMVVAFDAWRRRRRPRGDLTWTVALDTTLIGFGIFALDLSPAAVGAPYVFMMTTPLLVVPFRRALPLMGYATAWTLIAISPYTLFPLPSSVNPGSVGLAAYLIFTILLLVLVAVMSRSLDVARRETEQRLRDDAALAAAGQELLGGDEEAMWATMVTLEEAFGARAVFVGENTGDPDSGPAASVVQVSSQPDGSSQRVAWTLPYLQHAEIAAGLSAGNVVGLDTVLELVLGREYGEVTAWAAPVSVGGEWVGFLGIAYDDAHRSSPPDPHLLRTLSAMVSAFMERRQAYRRLERLVESKDRFLASVSHEIRTPLTSVLGFAEVLREAHATMDPAEAADLIQLIHGQAQEVADLIEDLLVAARSEIDAVTVESRPVDLAFEIDNVLSSRLSDSKTVRVDSRPDHRALADPTRVRQIIRNLLTNAIRYGGDEITIATHRAGPEVVLVFSDNGEGIPPRCRQQIFDPYYRGQSGMAEPKSVGLGLAVSRQLARLMDGDLNLRPDLGPSTFELSLPAAPADGQAEGDDVEQVALVGVDTATETSPDV